MTLQAPNVGTIVGATSRAGTCPAVGKRVTMARRGNLDVRTIEATKPRKMAYRLSDGGSLLLLVKPSGVKVWVARVTVNGKRRDVGLGGFPTVSLRDARESA